MSFITIEGEAKIALKIATNSALSITQFVFANIPSLGIEPVDRIEALPSAGYIVDTRAVTTQGYVSTNKVVYSEILDSSVGDYQFNWVGLKDADGVLIACEHLPLTTKTKTNGGVQGNNLARNFLIEFSGAQTVTGISTPAATWQFNFTNRLAQIDERERLSNFDQYGSGAFFGTGFLVTHSSLVCSMALGIAFIGGIRCEKTIVTTLTAASFPTDIYIDASLQGDISGVDAVIAFTSSVAALSNYTDGSGFKHYVYKIASIDAGGVVTDLRKVFDYPVFDYFATKKDVKAAVPVGSIFPYTGSSTTAPAGYVFDGSILSRTTYADLYALWVTSQGFTAKTFTVTIAAFAVFTKTAHGFTTGERLRLFTTGALPTGLNTTTDYFVETIDANTFYLTTSKFGYASRIITTGTQSGTHTFLQSLYGLGDGSTTFNAPSIADLFIRGQSAAGRLIGTMRKGSLITSDTTNGTGGDQAIVALESLGVTLAQQNNQLGFESYTASDYVNVTINNNVPTVTGNAIPGAGLTGVTSSPAIPPHISFPHIIKY